MTNPVAILSELTNADGTHSGESLWLWCPGCEAAHNVYVSGDLTPQWEWNRDLVNVTISPSILCHYSVHLCKPPDHHEICPDHHTCGQSGHLLIDRLAKGQPLSEYTGRWGHNLPHTADPAWGSCHSFVRDGHWQFLADSAHALAGQTVPLVPMPDWMLVWSR